MKNLNEQVQELVKINGRKNKQEIEENIIEWTTFFRRNIISRKYDINNAR